MNFYASPEYLSVLAEVFFRGHETRVVDVRIGDEVLRLLEVDGKRLITSAPFLDYHEPLSGEEIRESPRSSRFAENVALSTIEASQWVPTAFPGKELAPYIDWSMFPTYDDYKEHIMQRQRGLIRDRERRGRRLAEQVGALVFQVDDAGDDVLELASQWKSRQLRETGQRDYFTDPNSRAFFEALRAKNLLVSSTLRGGGRLLATWMGFIHGGVWSGWIFTYDPELSKYSVGHQLLSAMLEESHRRKHAQFDFSIGAESYKMMYATHGRLLGSVGSPPLGKLIYSSVRHLAEARAPSLLAHMRTIKRTVVTRSQGDVTTPSQGDVS